MRYYLKYDISSNYGKFTFIVFQTNSAIAAAVAGGIALVVWFLLFGSPGPVMKPKELPIKPKTKPEPPKEISKRLFSASTWNEQSK